MPTEGTGADILDLCRNRPATLKGIRTERLQSHRERLLIVRAKRNIQADRMAFGVFIPFLIGSFAWPKL